MSNQANTWTFTGRVARIETRNTKTGKEFRNLTISQPDGQYTRLCVCTLWGGSHSNGLHEGAEVTAKGRIDGREYNGKYYAGLTATAIETHGAQPAERLAEPERVRSVDRANAQVEGREAYPPTHCSACGKPHRLTCLDAGSDREIKRLCVSCYKQNAEPDAAADMGGLPF